jgi:uncharacterized membrane protein
MTQTEQGGMMKNERAALDRVGAFSDGVIAVVITLMVLELKPPAHASFQDLALLWPTALSYAVSYFFIAIVWVNHHHLLRFAERVTQRLVWCNFAHLFMVSLVPLATEWVAGSRFAAAPVVLYALIFLLVNLAYLVFQREVLRQAGPAGLSRQVKRMLQRRSVLTLGVFLSAMCLASISPGWGFALICGALLMYLRPEVRWTSWWHRGAHRASLR